MPNAILIICLALLFAALALPVSAVRWAAGIVISAILLAIVGVVLTFLK